MSDQSRKENGGASRSAARLAAVQALYQLDMTPDALPPRIVAEFEAHRLGQEVDGDKYKDADQDLFADIVTGATQRRAEIENLIAPRLGKGWKLERLEKLLSGIIRAAIYEMLARPDVPTKVIINEYLNVTHAFYDPKEAKFVNGILDNVQKEVRATQS